MQNQYVVVMSSSVLGIALTVLSPWDTQAATLNTGDFPDVNFIVVSDTSTFLDLKFDDPLTSEKGPLIPIGEPLPPAIGGGSTLLGPVIPVFSSDYWNVSAQTTIFPSIGSITPRPITSLFVEQVTTRQGEVPKGQFSTLTSGPVIPYQRVSYLADSPTLTFPALSFEGLTQSSADQPFIFPEICARGSASCVSYDLLGASTVDTVSYELRGFFQPSDVTEAVPEPSSVVGSLAALLALFGFTRLKKSLSKA